MNESDFPDLPTHHDGSDWAPPPPPQAQTQADEAVRRLFRTPDEEQTPREGKRPLSPTGGVVPDAAGEAPPVVPGYELLQWLGQGGMGVVWKARQVALGRLVALKFLREGRLGTEGGVRFRTEAAAIARLQHPNIVQVHEVGQAQGQAYLTLEYVAGGSLADRLARAPLPAREAATLVETLATAMAFAHAQGVIHRDLKPSNILLAADGTPKISDFGLAKLLDPDTDVEGPAPATRTGAILGTPSYMAPEQATASKEIGPATDVWALGTILFECLTGRPPFKAATTLETLDQVRSQDPVPPRRLQPSTPRDLETICLRCLHKEPSRRFASATELADDLRCFLRGEPIRSRPVGWAERAWKLVRRRPALVGLAAFSVAALLTLVIGGLVYQSRLRTALEEARRERGHAADHYEKMLHAVDVLLTEVGDQRLENVPEMEEARARLLDEALRFYRQLAADRDNPDPNLRRETGRALSRTSRIQMILGDLGRAETDGREAVAILERLCEEFPHDDRYPQDLASACGILANVCDGLTRRPEAIALTRRQIALLEAQLPRHPELRAALALGYTTLGGRLDDNLAEARDVLERALALTEENLRDHPEDLDVHGRLGAIHLNLGLRLHTSGSEGAAESHYRQAVTAYEKVVAATSRLGPTHGHLAAAYHNLASLLLGRKRWAESEECHRKARDLRQQIHRRNPRVPACASDLAQTCEGLANLYVLTGRAELARQSLHEAAGVREALVRECPKVSAYAERLNVVFRNLARLEAEAGHPKEAVALCRKALKVAEALAGERGDVANYQCALGATLFQLGHHLGENKEPQEGLTCCTRAVQMLEDLLRREPRHAEARLMLRGAYAARGKIYMDTGQPFRAFADLAAIKRLDARLPEKDKPGGP
jgi:tetratricopeptide (TPR) repeat protein